MCINFAEQKASKLIRQAFTDCFDDVRVIDGLIIPMQESSRIPTGEFDTLVICNAGVFAFEVKNWNHASLFREQEKTFKQWCLKYANGEVKKVCDPIAQGIEKRDSLTQLLALSHTARSYVFLPGNGLKIDPKMPAAVLGVKDLPYIPRFSRA